YDWTQRPRGAAAHLSRSPYGDSEKAILRRGAEAGDPDGSAGQQCVECAGGIRGKRATPCNSARILLNKARTAARSEPASVVDCPFCLGTSQREGAHAAQPALICSE